MMDEDGSLKYRSGPWTKEEEEYAQALMKAFRAGHLDDLEEGSSLRKYLARKLQCSSKRISKKFEGKNYQGKLLYLRENDITEEEFQRRKARRSTLETKFFDSVVISEQTRKPKHKSSPSPSATAAATTAGAPSAASLPTRSAGQVTQAGLPSINHQGLRNPGLSGAAQREQPSANLHSRMEDISSAQSLLPGNPLLASAGSSTLRGLAGFNPLLAQTSTGNSLAQQNALRLGLNPLQLSLGSFMPPNRGVSGLGSAPSLETLYGGSGRLQAPQDVGSSLSSLPPLDAARLQLLRDSYGTTTGVSVAQQFAATRDLAASRSARLPLQMGAMLRNIGAASSLLGQSLQVPTLEQQMLMQNANILRVTNDSPLGAPTMRASPVARLDQESRKRQRGPGEEGGENDQEDSKRRAS